jgi:hypothetical protein
MADNSTTLIDPNEPEEYPDWFELYNPSDLFIDLGGMYLTDDAANLRQYRIPDGVTMAPRKPICSLLPTASRNKAPLHTSFNLSKDGETLVLYDVDERGNQAIDQWTFDSMETDQSIGRSPVNASAWVQLDAPTPGRFNQDPSPPPISSILPAISTANACY